MTAVDKWLGKDFNQKLLWDPDSLAFCRAAWKVESVVDGVELHTTQVKMLGAVRSISYLTYSPDEFKTYVGYNEQGGSVEEIASAQDGALFAISGMNLGGDFFKYNGTVVNATTSVPTQANGVLAIPASSTTNIFSIYKNEDGNYGSITEENVMAAGALLVRDGKEQTFPSGAYYDTRMARSIIGIDRNTGNYMFATLDKGASGQADGATIAEAAFIARIMGMSDAICLAEGDAATMWAQEAGVLNVPSSAQPAKVASVIYVATNVPTLEGEGTADSPYLIDMPVKMKQMRKYAAAGGETYFKLTNDLNMGSVKTWFPVNHSDPFDRKIHFDGNGKTITNFSPVAFKDNVKTSEDVSYPSLFGVLYGSCKNLTIKDSKLDVGAKISVGFLGGYVGTTGKPATVENVHLKNCEIIGTGNSSNEAFYGGFGGQARNATFKNCSAEIVISAGGTDVGGFVGKAQETISFENCVTDVQLSTCDDPGSNMRYGGLLGWGSCTNITVKNCSASGSISCGFSCNTSAGLIAYSGSTGTTSISQCKSTVSMKNDTGRYLSNSAGMVGCHGNTGKCIIENCYATGDLDVYQVCGGIIGRQEKGTVEINNCYSTSSLNGFSGLGSIVGAASATGCILKMSGCIAWSPSIKASRPDDSKYASGAIVGSSAGTTTISGCVRRADMSFSDPARSGLQNHNDVNNTTLTGDKTHDRPYDGKETTETTVSAAAKAAGWSETIWDLSGDLPELKIFK